MTLDDRAYVRHLFHEATGDDNRPIDYDDVARRVERIRRSRTTRRIAVSVALSICIFVAGFMVGSLHNDRVQTFRLVKSEPEATIPESPAASTRQTTPSSTRPTETTVPLDCQLGGAACNPTQPTTTPTAPPVSPPPAASATYLETTGGATHTWTDYTSAGGTEGPTVPAGQTVQISCSVRGFKVADGNTWWYRIASTPWNDGYYASADAFYNNGQTSGSLHGTPFVDGRVPNC